MHSDIAVGWQHHSVFFRKKSCKSPVSLLKSPCFLMKSRVLLLRATIFVGETVKSRPFCSCHQPSRLPTAHPIRSSEEHGKGPGATSGCDICDPQPRKPHLFGDIMDQLLLNRTKVKVHWKHKSQFSTVSQQ